MTEVEAGGELTVDHFQPQSAGGDDSEENLAYACSRCNLFKGDFWPDVVDSRRGCRVLHPLRDELARHVRHDQQTGRLEPLTDTGRFHIALLELNRPALVALRFRRRLAALVEAKQRLLEAEIGQLRKTIAAQGSYIAFLRRLLGLPE